MTKITSDQAAFAGRKPRHGSKLAAMAVILPLLSACASHPETGLFDMFKPVKINWNDTKWCVPWQLQGVLAEVSRKFGPVTVYSTHRWPLENKRKGGKSKSYHLTCRATDFAVRGDPSEVLRFLKAHPGVGGYSYYPRGFYHIDTGPRRTW